MAQTLTGAIIEKATNKRPKSRRTSGGKNKTLTGYFLDKFFDRENKKKKGFLAELQQQFNILGSKSEKIKNISHAQVKLYQDLLLEEGDVASRMGRIQELLASRAELETQYFNAAIQKRVETVLPPESAPSPPTPVTENNQNNQPEDIPKPKKELNPIQQITKFFFPEEKMAEGGVSQQTTQVAAKNIKIKRKEIKLVQNFGNILELTMQTAGLTAISKISEMLKTTGPLSGFLLPFINSVLRPFANSLGVSLDIVSRLLISPARAEESALAMKQREFSKTWAKYLNNENFINQYIDRESSGDPNDPNRPPGYVPADWKDDPEFSIALNELCKKWGINANHLLGLMAIETGTETLDPTADNGKHAGLIQFSYGFIRHTAKMSVAEFKKLSRTQQLVYVDKYFEIFKLPKNPTAAQLYTLVFLPAFIPYATDRNVVLASENGYNSTPIAGDFTKREIYSWWAGNEALRGPVESDITVGDLEDKIKASTKNLGLSFESGGTQKMSRKSPVGSMIVSGPSSGFDTMIAGTPVELHGTEIVKQTPSGFQVFPVKNKKYDITRDPEKVFDRWKSIASGSNKRIVTPKFESGGSAQFWQMAAITSKEDTLHPQGQADVAQALYNRIAVGSYPGGRNLLGIITAPGQFQPTFSSPGAWKSIRDRKTAIAAVGNASLVDMAAKSITNPRLQKEAARFVAGRTDFQGESQKPYMKPGDVTRGAGYNFHGWFYDARLAKPAPVISAILSQTSKPTTSTRKRTPTVNTITIPFTNIKVPIPFTTASASTVPIFTEEYNARKSDYEMYLTRLG